MPALQASEGGPLLFRVGGGRRVRLWDGERISGQILEISKVSVRLRTAWATQLELPRAAVAAIEPLPGWRTVFIGEPAASAAGLRKAGEPPLVAADDGTAARAYLLRAVGQSLTYTVRSPAERGNEKVVAGRVGVNFQEREQPRGARWTVELSFQKGEHVRHVTVTIAGAGDHYGVQIGERGRVSAPSQGTARRVTKTPGWHRLIVQFSPRSLRLTCDDDVLLYNLDEGPGGYLQRVTIACQQSESKETLRGGVAWTEFCIDRAVDEHRQPPADAEQDVVRLLDDDQLFGRIVQADRRSIQIEGRFGKRALPWTEVSGCSFRHPAAPPTANEGAKVRLLVRSGLCAEPDVLEGEVIANDERQLVLRHALLGELTLPRGRVRESRPRAGATK